MEIKIWESVLVALLTGVLTYIIAPRIHWGIEKKKIKLKKRLDLLKEVRDYLKEDNLQTRQFRETILYSEIRPFLTADIINEVESNEIVIYLEQGEYGRKDLRTRILDRLSELEEKWV